MFHRIYTHNLKVISIYRTTDRQEYISIHPPEWLYMQSTPIHSMKSVLFILTLNIHLCLIMHVLHDIKRL